MSLNASYAEKEIEKLKLSPASSFNPLTILSDAQLCPMKTPSFTCSTCMRSFSRKDSLKRHTLLMHKVIFADKQCRGKRTPCYYQNCSQVFFHKIKLIKHIEEYHKGEFSTETYEFSSELEFLTWKEKEENNNYVFFSKQTGSKQSSKETKTSYFICQVDGHSKPHRSAIEPPRKTNKRYFRGSVKSDAFCPARMIVNIKTNGTTNVCYIKTHNHIISVTNTMYQPIPDNLKSSISAKLSIGVPVNQVYHDLRESLGERENRVNGDNVVLTKSNLLTKKNISDINRVIKKECQLHPDDSTSTYLLVQKLMCEEFNSILVYKPQGQPAIIGPKVYDDIDINKDLFVIAIQTKQQLAMFEKHGSQIVCIDSTHSTNQYAFPLVTLLVRDEFKRGYPVAFFISNHSDELTITPFFGGNKEAMYQSSQS
ncbi:uncharacterized protein LOC136092875 [Hydra vulgaris]|uniref:uncharacterized protein LOC136092875 n=1 Tax=Hydra vulgaris TaxID=6087 RepID=UPI0032EA8EF2